MLTTLLLGGALAVGPPPTPPGLPAQPPGPTPFATPSGPNLGAVVPTVRDGTPAPGSAPNGATNGNGPDPCNACDVAKDNPNGYLPCLKPRSEQGGGFIH